MSKIKVLVVDDSALVRQTLCDILNSDPEIEVVGTAADPFLAAERLRTVVPDVITLDIEMPRMDGLTFLQKIMSQHPLPVVMCSSLAEMGGESALKALEYGAVDIITKPRMGTKQFIEESRVMICDVIKGAAATRPGHRRTPARSTMKEISPKYSADVIMDKPNSKAMIQTTEKVVVVGASTGGTEALRDLEYSKIPFIMFSYCKKEELHMKTSILVRNGVSSELIDMISRLVAMIPWPSRRQAMGDVAVTILNGKPRVAEEEFGWNRAAVSLGINEFRSGILCVNDLSERHKPKSEEKNPKLLDDIRKIMEPSSQAEPRLRTTLLYTNMTAQSVYDALVTEGWSPETLPTVRTISNILNRHEYRLRTVEKTKVQKKRQKPTASLTTSGK